ncbi:methionine synthase / sulfite reductase-like protein [Dermatophagoides farinae]|uniref:Methionine synthase / sulfite reductase-like protein n=1 Tax=Dermatophagoides farinae TaxID=6954 RepID=A0A9D4P6R2_DERFA|nr:methionine synthase / sulfite reductase-like protein [Dermatophagoides farinae]
MSSSVLNNNENGNDRIDNDTIDDDKINLNKIRILYASQTGQAESISQLIYDQLCDSINQSILFPSDPPDKATKFFRWLRRLKRENKQTEFKHLTYALLGLGDTNYDNFANFSKQLNKFFKELGAIPYIEPAFADDAVGLELVTEPFIENLIATIVQHLEKSIVAKNPCCCHLNDTNNDNLHSKCEKDHHSESLMINSTDAIDNNIIIESVTVVNESNKNINSTTSVDNSFINVSDIEKAININTDIMNINRPVVSSCISLTSSDKCNLSDICRQLVEPSAQLESIVDIEQLNLPKIPLSSSSSSKEGKPYSSFIYSQKNLGQLPFYSYDKTSTISMKNFLTNKLNNADSTLNIGQVSLSKILFNDNLPSTTCCHRRKTLLECDVEYELFEPYKQNDWFVPGDSFGFYSANLLIDVYQVIRSIKVKCSVYGDNDDDDDDDSILLWDYFKSNRKQVFVVLNDQNTIVELLPYLFYGVDLRTIPKKATLCHLAQYTTDEQQRRRLLELSSRQGNLEYQKLILGQSITICDILRLFDTCHPPIDVLFAHLITAKPRYFSASNVPRIIQRNLDSSRNNNHDDDGDNNDDDNPSSTLIDPFYKCKFKIMFSVSTNFSHTFMRTSENLLGLFSGKFFRHYDFLPKNFQVNITCSNVWKTIELIHENVLNGNIFDNQDVTLYQSMSFPVYLFQRPNKTFRMIPRELSLKRPLILIATGTGKTMSILMNNHHDHDNDHLTDKLITIKDNSRLLHETFFIFGCRHPYQDFAYSDHIISLYKDQPSIINHLCLCFSRANCLDLLKFEIESQINLCCMAKINNDNDNEKNIVSTQSSSTSVEQHYNNYYNGQEQQQKLQNETDSQPNIIKHVDELIRIHGEELTDLIINHDAIIYICGNWKLITQDIKQAFCDILNRYHFDLNVNQIGKDDDKLSNNYSSKTMKQTNEAMKYLKQLQQNGRFVQDIWT